MTTSWITACLPCLEPEDEDAEEVKVKEETFIIMHNSDLVYYWDLLIIIIIGISLVLIPLRIGFGITAFIEFIAVDVVMDLLFIIDIVFSFFKSFEEDGEVVTNRDRIKWRYLKGSFTVDIMGSFPFEYVGLVAGVPLNFRPMFRVNRMFRFGRMFEFMITWERNSSIRPGVVGIFKSVMVILYCSHFVACIFHLVVLLQGEDSGRQWTSTSDFMDRPFHIRYMRSFYWAIVSLTGYTQGVPWTTLEAIVSITVTIASVAIFGAIIGVFGNLLTNLDSSRNYFRTKMDSAQEYMNYKKISKDLQGEVRDYYNYLWASGKALEKNDVVALLPKALKERMTFHLSREFISKVPFFADVKDDIAFMSEIVKHLKARIGLPNSFIVRKGEIGTEMFFIARGELNVLGGDTDFVVHTFTDGGFFGEVALMYQIRRTASIVARTFCDMYALGKEDFSRTLKRFPQQSKGIKELAKQRFDAMVAKDEAEKKKAEEEAKKLADERAAAEARRKEEEEFLKARQQSAHLAIVVSAADAEDDDENNDDAAEPAGDNDNDGPPNRRSTDTFVMARKQSDAAAYRVPSPTTNLSNSGEETCSSPFIPAEQGDERSAPARPQTSQASRPDSATTDAAPPKSSKDE